MKYDFTTVMDRLGKDAIAVDIPHSGNGGGFFADARIRDGFSIIPMWVADMNFPTVPTIPGQSWSGPRIRHTAISGRRQPIMIPSYAGTNRTTALPSLLQSASVMRTACWAA